MNEKVAILSTGKYSGQKPLFLAHPPNFETLISFLFFYFRKFVVVIIVIIFTTFLLSVKYWVGGDDFLLKIWKKRS